MSEKSCADCIHSRVCERSLTCTDAFSQCYYFDDKDDYVRVRHGEWRFKEYGEDTYTNLTRIYECSLCGRTIECLNEADEPYCHCGAKMDLRLCSDIECAPPYGDKSDCELYKGGYCGAKTDGSKNKKRYHVNPFYITRRKDELDDKKG